MTDWLSDLRKFLPADRLMTDSSELFVYDCDGFTVARARPAAVLFPVSTDEIVKIVRVLNDADIQIVPRGSGTGLTGGCVAYDNGVVISTVKMSKILSIDIENRVAHVQAGVRNTSLSDAVAQVPGGAAFHFAPDPSSQRASTIGGNAATNAGGIHVLKDFVTSSHVLGMEMVMPDGSIVNLGARNGAYEAPFDLPGLFCGSEGTLGIITSIWVRLIPKPTSFRTIVGLFASRDDACDTVSEVIARGHLPSAMEMMDGQMVKLVNDTFKLGFPPETDGLILCEIDGIEDLLDAQMLDIVAIFNAHHAMGVKTSSSPEERAKLWKARKASFGAIGKISPSYCTQDACVPRSMLRQVLKHVAQIGDKYGLTINNIFHAGDGNVHPIFLYDDRDPAQVDNVMAAAEEVLMYCIDVGGTLTGEHGVGVEKIKLMPYLFDSDTIRQFQRIKESLDPHERINAGKLIPSDRVKIELSSPGRHVPQ